MPAHYALLSRVDGLHHPTATNANTGLFQVQAYFFPFFHGRQQTNRNGARCPSTAWGRTSSCEFPWPESDSEWLRGAGKITGEVTKWCRGRLETARRQKQEGRGLNFKGNFTVLRFWEVSSEFGERKDAGETESVTYETMSLVVALGGVHDKQVWSCFFKWGSIYSFKCGFCQVRTMTFKTWNCRKMPEKAGKIKCNWHHL